MFSFYEVYAADQSCRRLFFRYHGTCYFNFSLIYQMYMNFWKFHVAEQGRPAVDPALSPGKSIPGFRGTVRRILMVLSVALLVTSGCGKNPSGQGKNAPPVVSNAATWLTAPDDNTKIVEKVAEPEVFERGSVNQYILTVDVSDPQGLDDIEEVVYKVFKPGQSSSSFADHMHDDGLAGDQDAGDGTYSFGISSPAQDSQQGEYTFTFQATDKTGYESSKVIKKVTVR